MENAYDNGYSVKAIDGFNDWDAGRFGTVLGDGKPDGGSFCNMLESFRLFDGGQIIFGGPIEAKPEIIKDASGSCEVLNASTRSVVTCRDINFLKKLSSKEMLFPSTVFDGDGSWLIKNTASAGGTMIRKYDGKVSGREYPQKFLKGIALGAVFVSGAGQAVLLGITRQLTGDKRFNQQGFLYGGLIYPFVVDSSIEEKLIRFGQKVFKESGIAGIWGADFIFDGKSIWLLEINPRFTASLELIALEHKIDVVGMQRDALAGIVPAVPPSCSVAVRGTVVCYAKRNLIFRNPQKWFDNGARDIPHEGSFIKKGEPILSLYSKAKSEEEVFSRLEPLARELYFG